MNDQYKSHLELCCEMVINQGLATGHADDLPDLMREVLWQYKELRDKYEAIKMAKEVQ